MKFLQCVQSVFGTDVSAAFVKEETIKPLGNPLVLLGHHRPTLDMTQLRIESIPLLKLSFKQRPVLWLERLQDLY